MSGREDLDLLDAIEVGSLLGKSAKWVTAQANAGVIPSRKVGRTRKFTLRDVADYLDSVRQQAANPLARNARQIAARNRRHS